MNRITFRNVVPQVFASLTEAESDVWHKELAFDRGHLYLVEADSGKGKSTFCSYVIGYRHDFTGSLLFDEADTRHFRVADWVRVRRQNISYLFQELRLFPELTALENVEIKNRMTGFKTTKQIFEWFDMLGIADKRDVKVGRMSFGQQQRVALMRALVQPFDFLLADEPISHLDDRNAETMAELIKEEADQQGASIIVTSIGKRLPLNYEFTLQL